MNGEAEAKPSCSPRPTAAAIATVRMVVRFILTTLLRFRLLREEEDQLIAGFW
jgi:hypothetical protein